MQAKSCAYIDGESHYIRAEKAWQAIHHKSATLNNLRYRDDADDKLVLVDPRAKVFWTRRLNPGISRAVYFTAATYDSKALYSLKLRMREYDLESVVIPELKKLSDQRANDLKENGIIEKPKQVDIALAVRMVRDAEKDNFDTFYLYSSDVDYLPAIKAVQECGKRVIVYGFTNGLSAESPLRHEPDMFVDLTDCFRKDCVLCS